MKKIFIIIYLIAATTLVSLAQEKPKSYISINMGATIALGDFSKAEAGTFNNWNNTAGFAKTGWALGLDGTFFLTPKFSLTGYLYYADHGTFTTTDAAKLGASYTDAFAVDYTTVSTSGRYQSLVVLVGPQYSIPFKKLIVDLHVMAGLMKSLSTPSMTVELEDQSSFTQNSSTASAFGWQAGAGVRYPLKGKWGLLLKTDYFSSNGIAIDNSNRNNSAGRLVTNQPMTWLNITTGVTYSLGK
jgi:hypothetical protein